MDVKLLEDIGLTKIQAKAYAALTASGKSSAPALAAIMQESRSNLYKVLDRLCELGLATKDASEKKIVYYPANPAVLEQLIESRSVTLQLQRSKLHASLPVLLDYYFAHAEQPSIRFFQGKEGIRHMFTDMLKMGKTVYLVRSPADVEFYDQDFFAEFRKKRAKLGIETIALTPDIPSAVHDPVQDEQNKFHRTWLPASAYTAAVEWDIYGDKIALISYGKEAMGIILESPQLADSFRQMFELARTGNGQTARKPS